MADYAAIGENLTRGKRDAVKELVLKALAEGVSAKDVLTLGLLPPMAVIGTKFKNNEIYVPEVLIAARAMSAGLEILEPILAAAGVEPAGKVVLGTVKGDLHDIGKNLVRMMLRGAGFQVIDIGVDVPQAKFVEAVKANSAHLVAMSALLTTTMLSMKDVIKELKASGLPVKTMIGGAPITQNFANEIGADGYGKDASTAVDVAKQLLGIK